MTTPGQHDTAAHLVELGDAPFNGADGEPALTGRSVTEADGKTVGRVTNLLADAVTGKMRYFVVQLSNDARRVLIPVGFAELQPGNASVVVPRLLPEQLSALPDYDPGHVSAVIEAQTRSVLLGTAAGDAIAWTPAEFYEHEHFSMPAHLGNIAVKNESADTAATAATDEVLMDYDAGHPDHPEVISGGAVLNNASDDDTAIDPGPYTGPSSKASSQFGDELDTYGPHHNREEETNEWENPHPQNDSF